MPRKKQVVQKKRRQKAYQEGISSAPLDLKPKGAFRVFHNYKLFAIIGAIVMIGSFGFQAFFHGNRGHSNSIRGSGVVRATPEAGSTTTTGAAANIKQYQAPPPLTIDPNRNYTAIIKTEKGDVKVQLLARDAPETVNNFVFLAKDGYYNGVTFFRTIAPSDKGGVQFVQAGDPTGTGAGGPGYTLPVENTAPAFDGAGVLAMAKPSESGAPNNGSQFFITVKPQPTFDGKYTVFGKVIDGLDVLAQFLPRNPLTQQDPPPGVRINSIEIQVS